MIGKKFFQGDNKNPKDLIIKFFNWGFILIVLKGLEFWDRRGLFHPTKMQHNVLQVYTNITGVIYNISTLLIPIICIILFKLICDIIYLFIMNKK
ncbi:hypothetical protein ACFIJ5_17885 (plasmid) [Haloimpatiens sp. FM7330]|uniref:hypothetical protein n=1 Tax=Haloimpatiens sp. FM7330 TaxID=3298610 RepID=UPI0036418E7D